jgi:HEAT repeat protein
MMGLFSWLSGKKAGADDPSAAAEAPQTGPAGLEDDAELQPGVPIEELSQALDGADGGLRVDAARALVERWRGGDLQAAEAIAPRLHELLDDPEPLVRRTALSGVQLLRKRENLERCASGVLAHLADPAPQLRIAAISAAVLLPGEAARQQVRSMLEVDDESMRFAAACALSNQHDSAALPELTSALHDGHRRQEALTALMSLGDAAALPEIGALFDEESLEPFDRTMTAAALARFGDERGKAWLAERIAEPVDDRPIAAEWAGRLGVQEAVPALEELSETEDDPARGAALRALGRLKAPGAEERLSKVAEDAEAAMDLRMDAAEGLAELGALARLSRLSEGESELAQLCRELVVEVEAEAKAPAAGPG